jgi:hypothetical protein
MDRSREPDQAPVVLRPKKRTELAALALSLVFVVAGALLGADGSLLGWLGVVFFGLCAIVFAVTLLPGAAYLRLEHSGFVVCSLFRADRLRHWDEVQGFRAYDLPGGVRHVGFDFAPGAQPTGSELAKRLARVEGALPNTYGMRAEDLAGLMNRWREECLRPTGAGRARSA